MPIKARLKNLDLKHFTASNGWLKYKFFESCIAGESDEIPQMVIKLKTDGYDVKSQ